MKFGVHHALWNDNIINAIKKAKKIGFDGVEFSVEKLSEAEIIKIKKCLIDNELECIVSGGVGPSTDISSLDENTRRKGIRLLKKTIINAYKLNSKLVTGSTYAGIGVLPPEGRTKERWLNSVNSLREVCRFAKDYDIIIGVEAINRFRNYLINTVDEALMLIDAVGEPNLVVHCDTFHMNIEEKNFYDPIKKAGAKLGYIHAAESDRGMLGTGHVDWDDLFKALFEINYNGWITIETFPPYIQGLSEHVGAWRWIFPSADQLASEGLKFLKRMANSSQRTIK